MLHLDGIIVNNASPGNVISVMSLLYQWYTICNATPTSCVYIETVLDHNLGCKDARSRRLPGHERLYSGSFVGRVVRQSRETSVRFYA